MDLVEFVNWVQIQHDSIIREITVINIFGLISKMCDKLFMNIRYSFAKHIF